jgi:hypothetical protein
LDRAWLSLLINHVPFLPVDEQEYARIVDSYRDLEKLVLRDPELQAYYAESFLPADEVQSWTSGDTTVGDSAPGWKLHHVVTLQSQLMEDAYYAFRLDRNANAHDNRGWMNLFRRWGNSDTFKARFQSMRATFNRDFLDFYDYYIRDLGPIDLEPVPHPWDPAGRREDLRKEPMLAEDREWADRLTERPAIGGTIPGVYLDSGIREATPEKLQSPKASPGGHAAGADKPSAPVTPAQSAAEGSSASDTGAAPNQ